MPSPFMQSIQGGRPASGQRRMRESAWQGGQHRMREGAWRGARADREGVPDWREQGRFGLAAHQAGTGQVRLANHAIN